MTHDVLLDALGRWHDENRDALVRRGLGPGFDRSGPESPGRKPVARLDLDATARLGSLLLWNTGEAELDVIDASGRQVLVEHRTITDADALRRAVSTLVSAVENGRGRRVGRSVSELRRSQLVQGLLREGECGPQQARDILALLDDPGALEEHEYALNVYFVTFSFARGTAVVHDDLDAGEAGELHMSLAELRALLADHVEASGR